MDGKDKIILQQLEVIRTMTEHNIKNMGNDIWGPGTGNGAGGKNEQPEPDADRNEKAPAQTDAEAPAEETAPENPKENIEDLKKELAGYIGLENIKKEVNDLINLVTVYKMRREHDLPTVDLSLHMVFSGNPGTGKTMIARLMARIYHALDILSKGQLVEVDRSGLVAGYVGQTAIKTSQVIEKAKGGVLFIDEAYALSDNKSENDFGQEAIDTILKAMEDNRDDLVVIVAGYIDKMEGFIHSNPGLESRFNRFLNFEDYDLDEMMLIFEQQCEKSYYTIGEDAKAAVRAYIDEANTGSISFGNARGVRNIFEKILVEQANRLASMTDVTREQLMEITEHDVWAAQDILEEVPDEEPKEKPDNE